MKVLGIDPGTLQSAWVLFDGARVLKHGIEKNELLVARLGSAYFDGVDHPPHIVIERIESFGMAVGAEVFETVYWTGRFYESALTRHGAVLHRMTRRTVKLHLCATSRAKDANIRQALVDRFGGLNQAKGTKRQPGPLHGIRADEWAALAVAVTWWDTQLHTAHERTA